MFREFVFFINRLFRSERGSVAVQIGVGLVVLVGMAGLGTESTYLLYKHRQMQAVADSAALSGAMALSQPFPRDPQSEARAVAARLGYVHGAQQVAVTVNVPPVSGLQAGNSGAVEVIVAQPQDLSIMQLFGNDSVNVGTRSVAIRNDTGRFCVLALDPSAADAMHIYNNAVLPNPSCGVAINSTSDTALVMANNAVIDGPVTTRGQWQLANNAELNGRPLIQNGPLIPDPYADAQLQPPPYCTERYASGDNGGIHSLSPGCYPDGWDFKNNEVLNLSPGEYYINSKFDIKNNVIIDGTDGVTIIIGSDVTLNISNNAELNITAPTAGNYAGLAITGVRDAPPNVLQKFSNNTVLNIQGAVYFPNQILEFDNNGATTPLGCTHVIGRMVRMMNNVELKNDCAGTGVKPLSPPALLVE